MIVSDLKQKIHQQVDLLNEKKIIALYGLMTNFINNEIDESEWLGVSQEEITGINLAINQLNDGKGIPHSQVMSNFRQKYAK